MSRQRKRRAAVQNVIDLRTALLSPIPSLEGLRDPDNWKYFATWNIFHRVRYHELVMRQVCSEGSRFEMFWARLPSRKQNAQMYSRARYWEICDEYLRHSSKILNTTLISSLAFLAVHIGILVAIFIGIPATTDRAFWYAAVTWFGSAGMFVVVRLLSPRQGAPRWLARTVISIAIAASGGAAYFLLARVELTNSISTYALAQVLTIGVATLLSQIGQSVSRAASKRWIGENFDAFLMGALEAVHHHVEVHKQLWPNAEYSRSSANLLNMIANAIESYMPRYLNAQGSATVSNAARGIAATFRASALGLQKLRGREAAAKLVLQCATLVASDQLLEMPQSAVTQSESESRSPRSFLRSVIAATLPAIVTIAVKYFGLASGVYVDALIALSTLWAAVRFIVWLDPDFATSLAALNSVKSMLSETRSSIDQPKSDGPTQNA